MSTLVSINPSTYQTLGEVEASTLEVIKAKVSLAHKAKKAWRDQGIPGRVELMHQVIQRFERDRKRIVDLTAQEMGMPVTQVQEDVDYCIEFLNSYCDTAEQHLQSEITYETDREIHEVFREPYGVAATIVPWNFPLNNWVWQCGQSLIAGNTVVFKHSEETQLCGKLIEEIVCDVLPEGVFNEVYGDGSVGQMLVNQDVDLICFTGSTKTGMKINEAAAGRFIKTIMELGGSAPGLIFQDADINGVSDNIYTLRFMNCGQCCDGLKRLIVHESKFEEVVSKLTDLLKRKRVGDSLDTNTDIGPLVAKRQLDLLEEQVTDAVSKGAKVVTGGKRVKGIDGAYYEPTLLTNVSRNMRVWQEEVFGPVLPIVPFTNEDEAIELANDTKYGLGAYIFTNDKEQFMRIASQLESGMVSQNNLSYINVCNPFGGYKHSGGSREHAQFGFHEVTQTKVVAREK